MYVLVEVYCGIVNEVWIFKTEELAEKYKDRLLDETSYDDDFDYVIMKGTELSDKELVSVLL